MKNLERATVSGRPGSCLRRASNGDSRRFIWYGGLSGLSRSSNQTNQRDQRDRKDQMNQLPATRRKMVPGTFSSSGASVWMARVMLRPVRENDVAR
jgi:hypothetical protein